MPSTHLVRSTFIASRRIVDACSAFQAMTGIITFSSSWPASHASAIVVSHPITWKQTWLTISGIDGFTLPGMIDEPGCTGGSVISASPARGPMLSSRRSLATLPSFDRQAAHRARVREHVAHALRHPEQIRAPASAAGRSARARFSTTSRR